MTSPGPLPRAELLSRVVSAGSPWDMVIIGGGATGMGIAVDAAARGYRILLLEQHDFGKGTSSRSTKLIHGGVRYLGQGNFSLVFEALRERGILRRNAPHLVHELPFVVPVYAWWEGPFYGIGLKLYQVLAGRLGFGPTEWLSRKETLRRLPSLQPNGLRGGIVYHDGQFDDARLLTHLAATALDQGAALLNYFPVTDLLRRSDGRVEGVTARDAESGAAYKVLARVVINATGPFVDSIRRMVRADAPALVSPSQGAHIVLARDFLPGHAAIMVPRTSDGRVIFAIPWNGHTLVGTTDTPIPSPAIEPRQLDQEIDFLLETLGRYLRQPPRRADILSAFAGIRPLVAAGGRSTASLSREHTLHHDVPGLITITGGKWTTYRSMAESCVTQAALLAELPAKPPRTRDLRLHGYDERANRFGTRSAYGSDAPFLEDLIGQEPELGIPLHPSLTICGAEIVWAARREMARTVEDALARRTRALFLNAGAASAMAPQVARLLARELDRDADWERRQVEEFQNMARGYQASKSGPGDQRPIAARAV